VKIISFSGIDGAGKSTQIDALDNWLHAVGRSTTILTFWDHVAAFSRFRETVSYKAFKGDQGIGSPDKPLNRRDKNVTSWPVSAARFGLYFADALNLRRKLAKLKKSRIDVVIFDRYIFDELANLPLQRGPARLFARFLLRLAPAPDAAFIIDADPVAARERKPEYPLDFLRNNRESYLALSRLSGTITVIEPGSVEEAESKIRETMLERLSAPETAVAGLPALQ